MNDFSLEKKIAYKFSNRLLLRQALTHSSAANEMGHGLDKCNERLEFLGDAVLNLVISKHLYDRAEDLTEGQLSKLRATIVCERSLAERGKVLGLDGILHLGRGEELSGGRERPSIIADAVEALIGSIYLDGGFEAATSFVIATFEETIEKALVGRLFRDYKTEVQEILQGHGRMEIDYRMDNETGPDHDKTFFISLWNDGIKLGEGRGKTKKEGEQEAAKAALEGGKLVF